MQTFARLLVLVCVLVAMSSGIAQAGEAGIPTGLYTCYSSTPNVVGGLTYQGSMVLKANGTYAFAYSVKGRTLVKPRSGTYKTTGSRITFSGGPLGAFYGLKKDATKFVMHLKENRKLFTWCYLKT